MEDLLVNKLDIFSDKDTYELFFNIRHSEIIKILDETKAIIIDKNVLDLYQDKLSIDKTKVIEVEALEEKKRPDEALELCSALIKKGITRKDTIVAIGGGITQDLVTFSTSVLFRGIKWIWFPTTLLAQADSCIGGKSSLNFKEWKNIIGNFYPPHKIYVQDDFLSTLTKIDIRSGIGEILKVHLLSGENATTRIVKQMEELNNNKNILSQMVFNSLKLKNSILKIDPLDQGLRLKMNYGHSFGHALESATNFQIPHGIAVTIGLDIANFIALQFNKLTSNEFQELHKLITSNLKESDYASFNFNDFIKALKKDKKNSSTHYNFIIPSSFGEVELTQFIMNDDTNNLIGLYFEKYYK
jgi:3-dehydroquinate synthase